jgi:hypothetical protein
MTPRRLKTGQLAESISAAGSYALSWRKSAVAHGPDRSLRPVPTRVWIDAHPDRTAFWRGLLPALR